MNTEMDIIDKINAFINNYDGDTTTLLEKIMTIIKDAKKDADIYFLVNLIKSNNKLNKRLKELVDANIDDIKNELYPRMKVMSFIKAYALLNDNIIYDTEASDIDLGTDLDIYRMYIKEINNIPLLTASEEKELAIRYKQGDMQARKKFVESNLKLVVSVAKNYLSFGIPLLDLIEDGNLGLIKALDGFNPELGYRFSTYAYDWIRQAIVNAICSGEKNIAINNHVYSALRKFRGIYKKLEEQGKVDLVEVATLMGVSIEKVKILNQINQDTLSFSHKSNDLDDVNGNEFGDTIADPSDLFEDVAIRMLPEEIEKLIDSVRLDEEERTYLIMKFGLFGNRQMSYDEIGEIYGKTRPRIHQVVKRALKRFRDFRYTKSFLVYLGDYSLSDYYLPNGSFDMDAYRERTKNGYISYGGKRRSKSKSS